jgi:hypothetical protein
MTTDLDRYRVRREFLRHGNVYKPGDVLPGPREKDEVDEWIASMPAKAKTLGYRIINPTTPAPETNLARYQLEGGVYVMELEELDGLVVSGFAWPPGQPSDDEAPA